jgi:hypothetical protein
MGDVVQTALLSAVSKRGVAAGTLLTPHKHADGCYVASKTRFESDYVRVSSVEELLPLVQRGYGVRMSNPDVKVHRAPSLIAPKSIRVERR